MAQLRDVSEADGSLLSKRPLTDPTLQTPYQPNYGNVGAEPVNTAPYTPPGGPTSSPNLPEPPRLGPSGNPTPTGSPQDFIAQYQQSHPASGGIAPLADALKAAGYSDVSRFMYGQTPSNNEFNIGGQKFKVISGEDSSNPSWYVPGTNDSGGGGIQLPNPPTVGGIGLGSMPPGWQAQNDLLNQSYMDLFNSANETIRNPVGSAQFEALRQPIDKARQVSSKQSAATLADRGMLNGSGEMAQASGRIEDRLAPIFSSAVENASVTNSQNARQNALAALQGNTNLQGLTSDVALRNLDQNRQWQQFLASYGLDRARVAALIDQGYGDQILKAFELQNNGAY